MSLKLKPTDNAAVLHLKTGQRIQILVPKSQKFAPSDFRETTIWRFEKNAILGKGNIMIVGDRINYIEILY